MRTRLLGCLVMAAFVAGCAGIGRPPTGRTRDLTDDQKAALKKINASVQGTIVWSSSRVGNHDLFLMNADGTNLKALTHGKHVDWFPRWSDDGKRVLFNRGKKAGWVSEKDCNLHKKWDTYTITPDGQNLKLVAKDSSWATWTGPNEIMFARKTQVLTKNLDTGEEQLLVDSTKVPDLGNADLQNPYLSPDRKHVSITLRGAKRETGIFHLESKEWVATGQGCQVNWFPQGGRILWVNPSGKGGSEVFSVPVADGRPTKKFSYGEMRFIDIPHRNSHEYFPMIDRTGKWMVWAATQRGHDHDIADYEIFIWKIGAPAEEATRLTFHSGNDRWPDLHVAGP